MRDIWIQKSFAPLKKALPAAVWQPIRRLVTGLLVPALFSIRSGHFKSALRAAPVSRDGTPIPWYTYPCNDFLAARDFSKRQVLEFGGGHSTLWWARKAASVLTFDESADWCRHLQALVPRNAAVHYVALQDTPSIQDRLPGKFDVAVVDGLDRGPAVEMAIEALTADGALICDNSEAYDYQRHLRGRGLSRVDFFGYAAGVVNPQATSIYFRDRCFLFDADVHSIPDPLDLKP